MAPYARAAGVVGAALAGCRDGGPEARMAVRRVGDAAEAEPEAEAEGVSAVAPGVRLGAQRGGGERGEQRGEAGAERGGVAVADAGGAQPIKPILSDTTRNSSTTKLVHNNIRYISNMHADLHR